MKRIIQISVVMLVTFVTIVFFFGSRFGADSNQVFSLPQVTKSDPQEANSKSGETRSVKRVLGGVSENGDLTVEGALEPNVSKEPTDDFIKKIISQKWLDPEGKVGRRRVRIVEADFKYQHIRLEEEVWTDSETGKKTVKRTRASVADHVMVGLKADIDEKNASKLLEENGYRIRSIESGSYILAELPVFQSADDQPQFITAIEALNEFVDYAEPDWIVYPSVSPNDPAFLNGKMWGLDNLGFLAGADVDAPEAWEIRTDASSVIVAVTDTGIQYNHEDLAPNMWSNSFGHHGFDAYGDDNDPMDIDGHGTHCAGTIGAKGNNNIGLTGVAWDVQLMAGRFLGPNGGVTSDGVRVINYARINGAHIINASWGGGGFSNSLFNAIRACGDAGIPFVAAAGNDALNNDSTPHYPSSYDLPTLIAVASTTRRDKLSTFSCFGRYSVDIAAPGSDIWSTYIGGANNSYKHLNGTSMATPHVSGALALARAHFPTDEVEDLIARLYSSVDPVVALSGKVSTGGRLNLETLLGSSTAVLNHDEFVKALRFEGDYGYWSGSNRKATREANEDSFSLPNTGNRSLWFAWKAPFNGLVEFKVRASDTPLRVVAFSGGQKGELSVTADSGSSHQAKTKTVRFYCQQDQEYRFLVDSNHTSGQTLAITLGLKPLNDTFGGAITLSGDRFTAKGSNRNATSQNFEIRSPHAGVGKGKSVWWKWTPDFGGEFVVTTQRSEFDTVLAIYTGLQNALTEVASNDDRGPLDWTSQVTFNAVSGTTYYIAVDGYRGDAFGEILLSGYNAGQLVIIEEPQAIITEAGSESVFSVKANRSGLDYSWFKNGIAIPFAHSASLVISNTSSQDEADYMVTVSDGTQSVDSRMVSLSLVKAAPEILWQSNNVGVSEGENLRMRVYAVGSGVLSYQWYFEGELLDAAVGSELLISNVDPSDSGEYEVIVSNENGMVSSAPILVAVQNRPWGNWEWINPFLSSETIVSMEYLNGNFIGFGRGVCVVSDDGEHWDHNNLPTPNHPCGSVAYGNGVYVATSGIGSGADVLYSTNLREWLPVDVTFGVNSHRTLDEVVFGNGIFVGRASDFVFTSSNGIDWVPREFLGVGEFVDDVAFGGEGFMLITSDSAAAYTSTDGVNWSKTLSAPPGKGILEFFNGSFHCWTVGSPRKHCVSTNGDSWVINDVAGAVMNKSPFSSEIKTGKVLFDGERYIYAEGGRGYLVSSADGVTWERKSYELGAYVMNVVAQGGGKMVVAGPNTFGSGSDFDEVRMKPIADKLSEIGTRSNQNLTVLRDEFIMMPNDNGFVVSSSSDGKNWRTKVPENYPNNNWSSSSLVYAFGYYWATQSRSGSITAKVLYRGRSPHSLKSFSDGIPVQFRGLASLGDVMVAIGRNHKVYVTSDGEEWVETEQVISERLLAIECAEGLVVVQTRNHLYVSTDGVNWSQPNVSNAGWGGAICRAIGKWCMMDVAGAIHSTSDFLVWEKYETEIEPSNFSMAGNDESIVILMGGGRLRYSYDLANWVQESAPSPSCREIKYANGMYLISGGGGAICRGMPKFAVPQAAITGLRDGFVLEGGAKNSLFGLDVVDPDDLVTTINVWNNGMLYSTFSSPLNIDLSGLAPGDHVLEVELLGDNGERGLSRIEIYVSGPLDLPWEEFVIGVDEVVMASGRFKGSYVLGDNYGYLRVSPDGERWRVVRLPERAAIEQIVQFREYLYVSTEESLFRSDDLLNFEKVETGYKKLEAMGDYLIGFKHLDGPVEVSADGVGWAEGQRTSSATPPGRRAIAVGGRIIANSDYRNGNVISSSEDGITWRVVEGVQGVPLAALNDQFFVVDQDILHVSNDGVTWTTWTHDDNSSYAGFGIESVQYVGGKYFMSLFGRGISLISDDSLNWTEIPNPTAAEEIYWIQDRWIALNTSRFVGGQILESLDGLNWAVMVPQSEMPSGAWFSFDAYEEDGGLRVFFDGVSQAFLSDELVWEFDFPAVDETKFRLRLGERGVGSFYAVSDNYIVSWNSWFSSGGTTMISNGGESWAPVEGGIENHLLGASSSHFYALNGGAHQIGKSSNGSDWNYSQIPIWPIDGGRVGMLVQDDVVCLYFGRDVVNNVIVSQDGGLSWVGSESPTRFFSQMSYVDGVFYGLTDFTNLTYKSTDGFTWVEVPGADRKFPKFKFGDKYLTIRNSGYDGGGTFWVSTDAVTWTRPSIPSVFGALSMVVWEGELYVALSDGKVISTEDLQTWSVRQVGSGTSQNNRNALFATDEALFWNDGKRVLKLRKESLIVQSVGLETVEFQYGVGDVIDVQVNLRNIGDSAVIVGSKVDVRLTLSSDIIYGNADDVEIGSYSQTLAEIPSAEEVALLLSAQIPEAISGGDYYLFAQVPDAGLKDLRNSNLESFARSKEREIFIPEWSMVLQVSGEGDVRANSEFVRYAHNSRVSLTANAGKGASFAGWGGDAVGAESQITILMNGDKSVLANFSSRSSLQVLVRGAGEVAGLADLGNYAVNDIATLEAISMDGWVFSGWSEAITDGATTASITMDSNKVVVATFTKLIDTWKSEYFTPVELANAAISGDGADPDKDGLENWQEYLHLSDPRDPSSRGVSELKVNGEFLYAIFTRNAGIEGASSLVSQGSRDMSDWNAPDFQERVLSTNNGTETVEARIPIASNKKGFLRLNYGRVR